MVTRFKKEEMREHAKYQIQKLGEERAVFSEIDEKKQDFSRLMIKNINDLIKDMKQEREELNFNLEKRKLDPSQLKKILDQNIFESDYLERYRSQKYVYHRRTRGQY